ncbi:hypothetical protein [Phaeocystidibacter marisrubri]|uniref:Bacterial Pleckstrin homology domain-containing protein n=1 Tax=Phaeocystidibacter marisrubri TaxID=1577780 RepID=A0A6L3ZFD7_9FLAO|nr:hypothetical protein [Phaeocystidibacter marisrubri]KAB2816440.1 hypothetical protein F8C82_12220 [Phaeocystidibacter marisrubri]GGH69063.1 hypothetical protein GCM10011318_09720 [Phaeocystidibacter marisrubri]
MAVYYAVDKDFSPLYLLAGTAATLVLLDLALYQETVVEVDGTKLKAKVSNFFNLIDEEVEIRLSDIQTRSFEMKGYSALGFAMHPNMEFLIPTYRSQLTIHTIHGKSEVIPIDISEEESYDLLASIPERVPNG